MLFCCGKCEEKCYNVDINERGPEAVMFLKFILALIPIIWLIVAMSILKMPGFKACFIAFVITFILAAAAWHLSIINTATAALEGICNALWPIIIVILAALFVYNLTLKTGAMEKIKAMLAGVSTDKRILMLLIAFGFGNFMEGMAGFGTAVAIPAGILVGLGFDPILSIVSCLIINSTPTAFGSVGVPTNTMANITGFDAVAISGNVAKIQLVVSFLLPFIAVIVIGQGVKALKGLIPMILIADISFLVPQYIVANVIGPDLANIIGAIEPFYILPMKSAFIARIDTGATTSSIDVQNLKKFERDGEKWVSFDIVNSTSNESYHFEKPVVKNVKIKRIEQEEHRVKVMLDIKIGGQKIKTEFTLAERHDFEYQGLIGRSLLSGRFIVDTSLSYTLK